MRQVRSQSTGPSPTGIGRAYCPRGVVLRVLVLDAVATLAAAGALAVAVLVICDAFRPTAKSTGSEYTRRLPAPAAIVAPVAVKLVPPATPLMLPQVADPVA